MSSYLTFVVTLFVLLLVTGRTRPPGLLVHFDNPRREALLALIPTAVLFARASAIFLGIASRDHSSASPTDDRADTYTFRRVVAQLGVGVSEEAMFRGYLQLRWAAWLKQSGWIAIAVICTLWHVPAALANSGTDIAAALTFGFCMRLTENIAGLSVMHAIMNVVCDV